MLIAASAGLMPARADIYVVESSVPAIARRQPARDSATIAIPAGGHIRAVLPSGKTQTIRGPYNGAVADLGKGQPRNEGVMAWIRSMLETGGSKEVTPGATRSIGRRAPSRAPASPGRSFPSRRHGMCREGRQAAAGARTLRQAADRVTVVDTANAARGEAQWEAGSDVAAWPAGVAPRSEAIYYLLRPTGRSGRSRCACWNGCLPTATC